MSDPKFYCRAEDLAIGYGKTPLMEHIGLGVGKGSILTLIGPNGAGKSTLLKTLAAQLAPQGGAVLLDGKDLADCSGPERARKMALMVPHTRRTELTTCFEMASAGRYPYTGRLGVLSAEDKRQVHAALALVGAEALAGRDFNRISDGQRQRVLLARAICQQPELILLDEPTSFLDIKGKAELLAILKSLARDKKMAVILSLHELELAQKVSDKVVCVSAAGVSDVMTPEEAFARENICKIYALTDEQYAFLYGEEKAPEEKRPLFEHYVRSGQKLLRCGYTTGTCAALGAAGAARLLLTGRTPETVALRTPKGIVVEVEPIFCRLSGEGAECAIRKDGGDDVDVTTGLPVIVSVALRPELSGEVRIHGGEGVGRVTKPGLDQPVGEAAINHVPRAMIKEALEKEAESAGYAGGFDVTISIEGGAETAKRTFNPHMGVEGGLSVLGTSGIVEPMSQQAILDTIQLEMGQAALRAVSPRRLILAPGNYGLDYLHEKMPALKNIPVVKTSNFIGDTMDMAAASKFEQVVLVGHIGKLVKLAGGVMNTHSRAALRPRRPLRCVPGRLRGPDERGHHRRLYGDLRQSRDERAGAVQPAGRHPAPPRPPRRRGIPGGSGALLESIRPAGPDQNCKGAAGRMEKRIGTFYGVSVGPGDPELMTLQAVRRLENCPVIAAPQTPKGGMLALDIAKGAVDLSGKTILPLHFAMSLDPAVQKAAHIEAARAVKEYLDAGQDVAMLNLGDLSVYATFGYLQEILEAEGYKTVMLPGVTSFCAAAARLGQSLTGGMEQPLTIAPGRCAAEVLAAPGAKVLMKSGRQLPETLAALADAGLLSRSAMVCNCGLPNEEVWPDLADYDPARSAGYFATILVKEG